MIQVLFDFYIKINTHTKKMDIALQEIKALKNEKVRFTNENQELKLQLEKFKKKVQFFFCLICINLQGKAIYNNIYSYKK